MAGESSGSYSRTTNRIGGGGDVVINVENESKSKGQKTIRKVTEVWRFYVTGISLVIFAVSSYMLGRDGKDDISDIILLLGTVFALVFVCSNHFLTKLGVPLMIKRQCYWRLYLIDGFQAVLTALTLLISLKIKIKDGQRMYVWSLILCALLVEQSIEIEEDFGGIELLLGTILGTSIEVWGEKGVFFAACFVSLIRRGLKTWKKMKLKRLKDGEAKNMKKANDVQSTNLTESPSLDEDFMMIRKQKLEADLERLTKTKEEKEMLHELEWQQLVFEKEAILSEIKREKGLLERLLLEKEALLSEIKKKKDS